jgi:hypothetical protein
MFESFKIKRIENRIKLKQLETVQQFMDMQEGNNYVRDDDKADGFRVLDGKKAYYTEQESQDMRGAASRLYYSNPIAKGIIETLINFIVGQTMTITPVDESEAVAEYWKKFQDQNKWEKRSKEKVRRVFRDGESFDRFFNNGAGAVPLMRFVNATEIENYDGNPDAEYGIECDPDDVEQPLNYYRKWYINDTTPRYEVIPASDIIHTKINVDLDVKRGVSFFAGIAPYLTKYKNWLEDRIELNRMRTIWNIFGNVTGLSSTATVKSQLPDTSPANTSGINNGTLKQAPKRGSVMLAKGIDFEYKSLNIDAQDAKADGRAILLMITVGTGLAEYVVTGDTSNANYASTMVSESPMVKTFEAWQDFFADEFKAVYAKVIATGIANGDIPENSVKTITEINPDTGEETTREEPCQTSLDCDVNFPILIHRDILKETQSLIMQKESGLVSERTSSTKLGYDYDEEKKRIANEDQETYDNEYEIEQTRQRDEFINRQVQSTGITPDEALTLWNKGQR